MKQRTNQFSWRKANEEKGVSNEPQSESTTTTSDEAESTKLKAESTKLKAESTKSGEESTKSGEEEPAKPKEKKKYIGEKRKKKFTGHSRTDFALKVYDKAESSKEACSLVVHDIFDNKVLCDAMHAAGWEPNQRGYTETQYALLKRFYRMKKKIE